MNKTDEVSLKSVYKKKRSTVVRRRKQHASCVFIPTKVHERTVHKLLNCEIGAESFSRQTIQEVLDAEQGHDVGRWLDRFATVQDQMTKKLEEYLSESKSNEGWRNGLSDEDVYYMLLDQKPLESARNYLIQMPKMLDKIYDISSLQLIPKRYRRDHLWLTLQWEIDGVQNPFLSRPCCNASTCLGKYIPELCDVTKNKKHSPLPELALLTTLDSYRIARCKGQTTAEFKECLLDKVQQEEPVTGGFFWSEPKCALCRMQDIFMETMNPLYKRTRLPENIYTKCYALEFVDMLPHFYIYSNDVQFSLCISETNVLVAPFQIPLIGTITKVLRRKGNEILVDDLYE